MARTKKDIVKDLKAANKRLEELELDTVEFEDSETNDVLEEKLADARTLIEENEPEDENDDADDSDDDSDDTDGDSEGVYVWLKSKAIVEEKNGKPVYLDKGLYQMKPYARLKNLRASDVEVFEDGIDGVALARIARWCGVNPDGRKAKELLEILVKETKTYQYK